MILFHFYAYIRSYTFNFLITKRTLFYFLCKRSHFFPPDANQTQGLNQRIIRTAQDSLSQGIRMLGAQNIVRTPLPTTIGETTTSEASSEIPDNVTAELEKLEQEGGASPMVEVAEGVNAIFGDLADDDDELLGKFPYKRN